MAAHGKICLISNCITRVYHHGNICAKHRWRKKKFGSYDLPNHSGDPSVLILPVMPDGFVKQCKVHGYLKENECYRRLWRGNPNYSCRRCVKHGNRRRNFGLENEDDYLKMLQAQDYKCAICKTPSHKKSNNGETIKSLCVDHCHKTGKNRELLCDHCNQGIGHFYDSVELLQSAIDYLKKHRGTIS